MSPDDSFTPADFPGHTPEVALALSNLANTCATEDRVTYTDEDLKALARASGEAIVEAAERGCIRRIVGRACAKLIEQVCLPGGAHSGQPYATGGVLRKGPAT
jgi:hypothetical protein